MTVFQIPQSSFNPSREEYVVGFLFSDQKRKVLLIRKNRPAWQKGKLNGIGGRIETTEKPIEAMVREFSEETGITTSDLDWRKFLEIKYSNGVIVHFFKAKIRGIMGSFPFQSTDEHVSNYDLREYKTWQHETVPDLLDILDLAYNYDQSGFVTQEKP